MYHRYVEQTYSSRGGSDADVISVSTRESSSRMAAFFELSSSCAPSLIREHTAMVPLELMTISSDVMREGNTSLKNVKRLGIQFL